MDRDVYTRIAQLAELGTQSPLHAMRAVEQITRLSGSVSAAQQAAEDGMRAEQANIYPRATARTPGVSRRVEDYIVDQQTAPAGFPLVVDARNHPANHAQIVQPMIAPTLWLTVANIPAIAPQTQSPGERLEFTLGDGILIGMRGTVLYEEIDQELGGYTPRCGPCYNALCGLRLSINGQEQLIIDGTAESWGWYSDLFGGDAVQWTPLYREVLSSDILTCRFFNRANIAGPTIQPSLQFAYLRLRPL